MIVLTIFVGFDIITGLIVAFVFKKSKNSETGGAESRPIIKGVYRKVGYYILYMISVLLTCVVQNEIISDIVLWTLIGGEGLSIIENLGTMGVPLPKKLVNTLSALSKKGDDNN